MTPGPASEIARLEPRNRPVPIAPPRPSMVIWRRPRRRCRPSWLSAMPVVPLPSGGTVFPDGFTDGDHILFVVVIVEGQSQEVAARGGHDAACGEECAERGRVVIDDRDLRAAQCGVGR